MDARISTQIYIDALHKTQGFCGYCGTPLDDGSAFISLMFPRSQGGTDDIENLMPACKLCLKQKGHMTLEEFRTFVLGSIAVFVNKTFDEIEKVGRFLSKEDRGEIEGGLVEVNRLLKRMTQGNVEFYFEELERATPVQVKTIH